MPTTTADKKKAAVSNPPDETPETPETPTDLVTIPEVPEDPSGAYVAAMARVNIDLHILEDVKKVISDLQVSNPAIEQNIKDSETAGIVGLRETLDQKEKDLEKAQQMVRDLTAEIEKTRSDVWTLSKEELEGKRDDDLLKAKNEEEKATTQRINAMLNMLDTAKDLNTAIGIFTVTVRQNHLRVVRASSNNGSRTLAQRIEGQNIRRWAKREGLTVNDKGAIPGEIREQWENAGSPVVPE